MRNMKSRSSVWRPHEENFGKQKDILSITMDQQKNTTLGSYCWPGGFWVDTNYLFDVPLVLNKNSKKYKFDKLVKNLYEEMIEYFANERTNHVFRLFGCDMSFVDAKLNYKIMDELFSTWKDLGLDADMELRWSTPSKYLAAIQEVNDDWEEDKTQEGWPIRRDDSFPYSQNVGSFMSGFYTSRPHLKKNIRDFANTFYASQRLVAQAFIRKDYNKEMVYDIYNYQTAILDKLGVLQHHDSITGTSKRYVAGNFNDKAIVAKREINEMNIRFLREKVNRQFPFKIGKIDSDMGFKETHMNYTSEYAHKNDTMIIFQNPTQQKRTEWVEIEMPYFNFSMWETKNNTIFKVDPNRIEKFLPRLFLNSNKTMVKSYAQFKVEFSEKEQFKIFIVKGLGVIREKNKPPPGYVGLEIRNLNVPIYLLKNGYEVDNFQSNFKKLKNYLSKIRVGKKTLQFMEIIKLPKGAAAKRRTYN